MPKRKDLKKILVVGAGPIIIGQACEFDYSGTQACKALRDEGFKVILINSNPATIMTDPDVADKTYIEPITLEVLEKILKKEKPDAILPTMGGQTALNLAMEAEKKGILKKYKIELIGANSKAIANAEDRKKFRKNMIDIGLDLPNRLKIWKFIEDLRQKSGLTVLLTTHYLEEAEPCDQVAFIDSGTIIKQGNPKSLITNLGDYIVEVQASTATKTIITKLLGEYLDGGGTSYFRCLQKDLNSLTDIQKENKKEIEMWRIRKPNLNDVFLWTTNNNTEYK